MNLRSRITALTMACGIVPTCLAVTSAYYFFKGSTSQVVDSSVETLESAAEQRLIGLTAGRSAHVQSYFRFIQKQAVSMAANVGLVEAMSAFSESFDGLVSGNAYEAADIARMRKSLTDYHRAEFGNQYEEITRKAPPIAKLMANAPPAMIAAQHLYLEQNANPLGEKQKLVRADDQSEYSKHHARFHEWFTHFQSTFGYYDVFLIDEQGRIVYSVFKEADFGTSLADGPWRDSGLGHLYASLRGKQAGEYVFEDYTTYSPSYEAAASFIGTPVYGENELLGYLAFQMPIEKINDIMTTTEGLGKTGEVVLIGADRLMRSDSRTQPNTHSVNASFANPAIGKLNIPEIEHATERDKSGITSFTTKDGTEQLVSYAPISVLGSKWCILARIDKDEITADSAQVLEISEASAATTLNWNILLVLITSIAIVVVARLFANRVTRPVHQTVAALKDIAEGEGDLTRRLEENTADELGEMGKWFNRFLSRIQDTVVELSNKSANIAAASQQLITTAEGMSEGAEQTKERSTAVASAATEMSSNMSRVDESSTAMTASLRTAAAAVEEMTASVDEIAKSATNAASVSSEAAELTRSSDQQISSLGSAADEIGRVIETIQDIAEQTNLLALNATIEAARAGEAGKGFSVVASEVKDLARQTADATQDIRQRIERIQESTKQSVNSIGQIDQVITKVSTASQAIAKAVSEQRTTTHEIAKNLSDNTKTVDVVNKNVAESVTTSHDIAKSIHDVDGQAHMTAAGAAETRNAGQALGGLATELQQLVGQFKI